MLDFVFNNNLFELNFKFYKQMCRTAIVTKFDICRLILSWTTSKVIF